MLWRSEIALKDVLIEYQRLQHDEKILVGYILLGLLEFPASRLIFLVWYGKHKNRGFMSPTTLESLGDLPFVEKRWELLANQLGIWKKQRVLEQNK